MTLRQWVLTVPFELRLLLAAKPDALSAIGRIFIQEIQRWQRQQASAAIAYAATQPPKLEKLVLVDVAGLGGPLQQRPRVELTQPRSAVEWARRRAESWVYEAGPVRDQVEALDLEELTRTPHAFERILESNRHIRQAPPTRRSASRRPATSTRQSGPL